MLYITSYGLKFHTMLLVAEKFRKIQNVEFWYKVNQLNSTSLGAQRMVYETLYWLNSGNCFFFEKLHLFIT